MFFRLIILIIVSLSFGKATAQKNKQMTRLAVIEVDTTQLAEYIGFLKEEIAASIEKEPGVITLYSVAEKNNPQHITLFETYSDSMQYRAHLATPHFQKYKQGTTQMVKHLELIEMRPVFYHRKPNLSGAESKELFIRLIKMEIVSSETAAFNKLATKVMVPGIEEERGVLMMYGLAEKTNPTRVSILEVYENPDAYNKHLRTTHFLTYKEKSKKIVRSLKVTDVDSILLGSKPQ